MEHGVLEEPREDRMPDHEVVHHPRVGIVPAGPRGEVLVDRPLQLLLHERHGLRVEQPRDDGEALLADRPEDLGVGRVTVVSVVGSFISSPRSAGT